LRVSESAPCADAVKFKNISRLLAVKLAATPISGQTGNSISRLMADKSSYNAKAKMEFLR